MTADYLIRILISARQTVSQSVSSMAQSVKGSFAQMTQAVQNWVANLGNSNNSIGRFSRSLRDLRLTLSGARDSIKDVGNSFAALGEQVGEVAGALIVKFGPALLQMLTGLAGALTALALSAGQAALALGFGLLSGIAQLIPVIGVFVLALGQLTQAMQVVQAQMRADKTAAADRIAQQKKVADAAHSVAEAEYALGQSRQGVKDAVQGVSDAEYALEQARKNVTTANQGVADSEYALEQARKGVTTANQGVADSEYALEQARKAVTQANQGVADSEYALEQARKNVVSAQQGVSDAEYALGQARQNVVDATVAVQDAERNLAQARKQAKRDIVDARFAETDATFKTKDAVFALLDAKKALRDFDTQATQQEDLTPLIQQAKQQLAYAIQTRNVNAQIAARSQLGELQAQQQGQERAVAGQKGERGKLVLGVQEATQALKEQRVQEKRTKEDSEETIKKGVEGSDRVRAAKEQLTGANEALAAAEHGVLIATRNVYKAQEDLARATHDLASAERDLARAHDGVKAAQHGVMIATRDLAKAHEAVKTAQHDVMIASRDLVKAHDNVARAQHEVLVAARGVAAARRGVISAIHGERDAAYALKKAHTDLKNAQDGVGTSAAALKQQWKDLTPVQRDFAKQMLAFEKSMQKGPIAKATAPLVEGLTKAIGSFMDLFKDPKFMKAFSGLAQAVGDAFSSFAEFLTKPGIKKLLEDTMKTAAHNVPLVAKAFENITKALLELVGSDNLTNFLKWVDRITGDFAKWAGNKKHVKDIVEFANKNLTAWFKLAEAVGKVFIALSGSGGSQKGLDIVGSITRELNHISDWIDKHPKQMKEFWKQAGDAAHDMWLILQAIFKQIERVSKAGAMKEFTDFLVKVAIPAIGNAFVIIGKIVGFFNSLLRIPGFAKIAQIIGTILVLSFAFAKIRPLFSVLTTLFELLAGIVSEILLPFFTALLALDPVAWIALLVAALVILELKFHIFEKAISYLETLWTKVWDAIVKEFKAIVTLLGDLIHGRWSKLWDDFKAIIMGPIGWLKQHWKRALIAVFTGGLSELFGIIFRLFNHFFPHFTKTVVDGFLWPFKELAKWFDGIGAWFMKHLINPILNFFGIASPSKRMQAIAQSLADGLLSMFTLLAYFYADLAKWFQKHLIDPILRFFGIQGGSSKLFKKIGTDVVEGFLRGWSTLADWFKDVGKWLQKHVINPILRFFGIESPSKLMFKIGMEIVNGLVNAFKLLPNLILGLVKKIPGLVMGALSGLVGQVTSLLESIPGVKQVLGIGKTVVSGAKHIAKSLGHALGLAKGGEVPGHAGMPVPITAHAGEWVLNEQQQKKLAMAFRTTKETVQDYLFGGGKVDPRAALLKSDLARFRRMQRHVAGMTGAPRTYPGGVFGGVTSAANAFRTKKELTQDYLFGGGKADPLQVQALRLRQTWKQMDMEQFRNYLFSRTALQNPFAPFSVKRIAGGLGNMSFRGPLGGTSSFGQAFASGGVVKPNVASGPSKVVSLGGITVNTQEVAPDIPYVMRLSQMYLDSMP